MLTTSARTRTGAHYKTAAAVLDTEQMAETCYQAFKAGNPLVKVFRPTEEDGLKTTAPTDQYAGGTLEGYASIFGNVDMHGDVVDEGAFVASIAKRLPANDLKLVDSHQMWNGTSAIIGKVFAAEEKKKGLWFNSFFSKVQAAQDIRVKLQEGILDALSFGYYIEDMIEEKKNGQTVWRLKKLDVFEVSVVAWGANPKARITTVKSGTAAPASPPALPVPDAGVKMASDADIAAFVKTMRQVRDDFKMREVLDELRAINKLY